MRPAKTDLCDRILDEVRAIALAFIDRFTAKLAQSVLYPLNAVRQQR
ncbi:MULTISPECIES: hypothetical protein [Cyanophyceae]|nr:hypothetical protein [Trichocoleus sp. FACHB-69]MBD1931951.1 hypothetical protein [Trichocoleus sp. FACHB-69]